MTKNTENLKTRDIKKKCQKHRKQDSLDSSLSDSDSFKNIYYKSKRRNKNKRYQKKDPINLCTKLTEKLLTTVYKL